MSSSTPSIRISHHQRLHSPPHRSSAYSTDGTSPMAIPRIQESAPPPLPPPSFVAELAAGHDPGWQWGNDPNGFDFGRAASVKPGSSLLGGMPKDFGQAKERDGYLQKECFHSRRGSSMSTVTGGQDYEMSDAHTEQDGGSSRRSSNYRLQSERQLEQRTLEASSNTYDKQLLSRIGGPNQHTPKRLSISYPAGVQETAQLAHAETERRSNGPLRPLSMPERRHNSTVSLESPASSRWPPSGAVSPGYTGSWEHGPSDNSRAPSTRHSSFALDSASHRGSYDHTPWINEDMMEEPQMSALHIHDRSPSGSDDIQPKPGSKRRALSPLRDGAREDRSSISSAPGQNEIYHRRSSQHLPSRGSPVSRFHPNHSSVSSASSLGPRQGSLGSSLGISSIPSSATSYASGRLSPLTLSPNTDSDPRAGTPFATTKDQPTHQRTYSEGIQNGRKPSTGSMAHSRHNSLSHLQGVFICECCPKKPKKFDTEDELRQHEAEKQYTCAYCPNRFKNKNEAERHQNSLHLRRHSWSCAQLAGVEAAFHTSTSGNGSDACGYCGEEFSNPPQWDIRAEHLNHAHKFGECNQTKKFFRADHFRQHLKHSHSGTSGKWTNMLETACMKDEPLPEKRTSPLSAPSPGDGTPPALMVTTTGLSGQSLAEHSVIPETPHDC